MHRQDLPERPGEGYAEPAGAFAPSTVVVDDRRIPGQSYRYGLGLSGVEGRRPLPDTPEGIFGRLLDLYPLQSRSAGAGLARTRTKLMGYCFRDDDCLM